MREWKLEEVSYKLVKDRRYEVAVLPIGSTEPHGLHMPYGSDSFEVEGIADRICEAAHKLGAKVILLPTIPYGCDSNLMRFPLTIDMPQSTLNTIVKDVLRSVEAHGLRKFVILNGHGGNDFNPLLRELHGQSTAFVCLVDWWKVALDKDREIFTGGGEHANQMETSVCMAIRGDLVRLEDADDGAVNPTRFEAINRGWVYITRPWHLLTKNSTHGDPRGASAAKGEEYIRVVVERVSRFLKELSDAKMDERFPY
ncbi:MAG: creatininase family protein [Planctomycetes bacterium]|nr:creatininase family protein [Planctomycetota bacterium]MBM4078768.1 creatininase family protein [Planctomycetota bacterium]MBM4087049.1 creatininase family protein [Planctomycetota bacterium]